MCSPWLWACCDKSWKRWMNRTTSFVHIIAPPVSAKLTPSLSFPPLFLLVLWQLTWVVGESDQLSVEGNQSSAPAGWGAILRAQLQHRSSARNAAFEQRACCYPRTSASLCCAEGRYFPRGWESEQVRAAVCQPLMAAGLWYRSNYPHWLLSEGKKSVVSQHLSHRNGCLILHHASPPLTCRPPDTALEGGHAL